MLDDLKSAARRIGAERSVRSLLSDCRRLLSERGAADSVTIARSVVARYDALDSDARAAFFERLSHDFNPDPQAVLRSAQAYASEPGAPTLVRLSHDCEPPRQELLRRINRSPGGTAAIVRMRRALLERLERQPQWRALEADMLHLLSSWFNPGFLELRRVDWNAPAQLLEQIIRHEAVHEIDGWNDLRRRLQPDRRCFAFFHAQLPGEPLIFVEVALLPAMPDAIAPLIDKAAEPLEPRQFKVAAFYSISNCQPGLRGVSLGNFLIKRVAEELQRELPQLRTFCTLSPMPGFAAWLAATEDYAALPGVGATLGQRAAEARAKLGELPKLGAMATDDPRRPALEHLAALYLVRATHAPGGDPVARFHLDNGARLERLNVAADRSSKGARQSFGLMVNYLYDLDRVESFHQAYVDGKVVHSRAVGALL
jgi:malonyl-CoA decarboxylase